MYRGRSLHIYIELRISKFEKHVTTSLFRYETFYYLWVERFFDIRRERYNLSILAFSSAPPQHVWHPPQRSPRVSESQPSRSVFSSQLTDFFKIFPNPPRASGAWRHSDSLASVSPLCTRAWTPVLMLHLTNPCAEPKGSQPN